MSKKAIVLVDDERLVTLTLSKELETSFADNYLIASTESPIQALTMVEDFIKDNYEIPVIISDYIMPQMKGDELLKNVHKISPDTKKIMLTGQASIEGIQNTINNASLYRFIVKPWDRNDLILTVKEAINAYNLSKDIKIKNIELQNANKKLQQLDKSKNYFLGLLSHELNTPITAITGFLEILKNEIQEEQQLEYLNLIHNSANRLKKYSEYSLIITKLLNDRYELSIEDTKLYEIIEKVLLNLKNNILAKNIVIENRIKNKEKVLKIDPYLIEKAIQIIIDNSIKYSNNGDTVTIEDEDDGVNYDVNFLDRGRGIDQNLIETIFDFFQSDELMHHTEGIGLGLSLAKIIMDVHKAKISIEAMDKGTKVILSFPA